MTNARLISSTLTVTFSAHPSITPPQHRTPTAQTPLHPRCPSGPCRFVRSVGRVEFDEAAAERAALLQTRTRRPAGRDGGTGLLGGEPRTARDLDRAGGGGDGPGGPGRRGRLRQAVRLRGRPP